MKNKITLLTITVALAFFAGLTPRASAQTYDRQHASTIVFAGSGTDPVNTLSILAPSLSGTPSITLPGQSLIFPTTNVLGMLWNDASGNLSWLTTLTGLTINNSTIGGTSSINTSGAITSTGIVTETNASNSFGGTFTGIFNGTVGAGTPNTGAFTTLSSTGNTNIDNTGTGQTINIGNSGSSTIIAGALNITGTVTYSSTPTIPLTTNDLFVGVLGDAAPLASAINSVLVTNGTSNGVPSWSTTLPTGLNISGETMNNETIGGTSSINTSGAITSTGIVTETNASNSFGGTFTGIFNGTVGAGTPSTGAFTTLSSTGNTNIDNTGTGQTINIGNSGSMTTISGAVTYTSTPTIPLTTNDLFVGVLGDAAPLASAINAVLVTNGTANGVPSWQTTLPSGLTIPSPTISNPSISNPSFSGTVTFSTPPTLPLTLNNIYVGNSSNNAAPVTPTANAVLITAGTGNVVPQWATTLPSGLTIPSPTINSPTINNPSFTGSLTLVAGSVTNADLANSTTAIGSTGSTLTFTGGNGSGAIALGGTAGNFELNLTHANTWTATQTHNNTTGNSAPLVANNTFVNLAAGNALGATITSTGAGAGTNTALTVTASNGATNDAIEVTSGLVKIDPFTVAGVVTNNSSGVLSSVTTLPSSLTIPSPTISSPSISNPTFTGTVTLPAGGITYADLPSEAANTLLGNPTGSAASTTTITLGTGLAFNTGALTISGTLPSGLTLTGVTINGASSIGGSTSISTSGNIATTGTGTITSAGLLTASNGLTVSSGTVTLPAASIANSALQGSGAMTFTSTASTLTASGSVALGGSPNYDINLTHANIWTATQTHYNTTGNSAPLVANNTFVNLVAGNALGATITSTGAGAGTNTALTVTASNGATNDAIEVTSGLVKIDPFTVAGVVTNNSSGVLSSVTTLPSGLTIPTPTINSPTINNPSFTGSLTLVAGSVTNADLANSTTAIGSTGSTLTFTGGNGSGAIALGGTAGNFEINLTHANTWSGTQTFGGAALTSSSPTALANGSSTIDWAISTSNSYFKVSAAGAATVNGIAGGVDGRVLVLVNTGANNITFNTDATAETTAANRIHLAGGTTGNGYSLILAPDGFVTFIYDSSYNSVGAWRVQSSK